MDPSPFATRVSSNQSPSHLDEPDLVVLATLLELSRHIHGEVVQISDDTWAIHGFVPYDGDIIVAEFHERAVADELLRLIPSEPTHDFQPRQPVSPPVPFGHGDTTIDLRDGAALAPADWDPIRGNPLPKRPRQIPSDPSATTPDGSIVEPSLRIDLTDSVIDLTDWAVMRGNPLPRRPAHAAPERAGR